MERELKKQKYEQYQRVKQTSNYQVPKSITIPVPDLISLDRKRRAGQPQFCLILMFHSMKKCWDPGRGNQLDVL